MYQIHTHAAKGLKAHVTLNQVQQLRVPASVFAGVGDKKKKYMNYLEKNFTDGANLYRVMCELHVIGIQNGHIALLSHPKTKAFHSDVLKEFMEKHLETLNLITPYVLQHETQAIEKIKAHVPTTEGSIEVSESIKKLITPQPEMDTALKAQLSDDDKNQIWALIQADQNKDGGTAGERPPELQTATSQEKADVQLDVSAENPQQEVQVNSGLPTEPVSVKPNDVKYNNSSLSGVEMPGYSPEPVSKKIPYSSTYGSTGGSSGWAPDNKEWVNNQPYETKPVLLYKLEEVSVDPTGSSFASQLPPTEGNEVRTLMPLCPPPEGCEVKTLIAPIPNLADVNVKSFWKTPEFPVKLDVKN